MGSVFDVFSHPPIIKVPKLDLDALHLKASSRPLGWPRRSKSMQIAQVRLELVNSTENLRVKSDPTNLGHPEMPHFPILAGK